MASRSARRHDRSISAALLIGDDGRVDRSFEAKPTRSPRTTHVVDGEGRDRAAGHDRRARARDRPRLRRAALDLDRNRSLAELQQRLRDYAAAHPGREMDRGGGWNQELWADKRFPTAADLDAVGQRPAGGAGAGRRPCDRRQQRGDEGRGRHRRHAGAARRRDPRRPVRRRRARPDRQGRSRAPTAAEIDQALAKAQEILLGYGVTGVGVMSTSVADWQAFRRAGDAGRLNVRLMTYLLGDSKPLQAPCRSRPPGCTTTGCARSASSSSPTARSARAARG